DTFQTTAGAFGNVDRDTETTTAVLRYNFNPDNPLIDMDVILSYADQQIDSTGVSGQAGFLAALVDADHRYETTKLTVKNTIFFDTGNVSHNLRFGVEAIQKVRLDANAAPGGTDNRLAAFVVNDMEIGGFEFSPALRYETSKIEGSTAPTNGTFENDALMGGVSARYSFGNGVAVFASAAYTENLPIIDDLGDATLMTQSEKSRTFEAGLSFDNGAGFAAKANFYDTRVWDITSYRSFTPGASTDQVEIRGLELEMSYAMANGLYVDVNGSITEASATLENGVVEDWENRPANNLQVTLGRKWDTGWDTSWEIVAAAERDANGTVSPGYAVHNARATWVPQQGVLEGTEIRFGVENVFDREYTPALSTRAAPGRNYKLTVMRTF
ncbi:MAG: TonB-dependent receptor, partial [Pseudomonadota bacterium]